MYNKKCVDHIDGNRINNNKNNLRFATNREINMNSKISSNNTSGFNLIKITINGWLTFELMEN